jgi:hypothetical protein
MRTAISTAAPPRHLHWQAAFTIEVYQALSPVVWHHAFVSSRHMTNWCGGSDLFLTWVPEGSPDGKAKMANLPGVDSVAKRLPLVASNGGGYAFNEEAHHSHRDGDHISSL